MKSMKNAGIYIITNRIDAFQYVGKDHNLPSRVKMHLAGKSTGCLHIHRAIVKYGAENFDVEIIRYPNISPEALKAVEKWKIRQLDTFRNGYNCTEGGDGTVGYKPSQKTRDIMSEKQRKRVADGINPFLGGKIQRENNRQRVENGTHNFLGGEISRQTQHKRMKDGAHHFLDSEWQQKHNPSLTGNYPKGEAHPNTHPKYVQAKWFFFLCVAPMKVSLRKKRKEMRSQYPDVSKKSIYNWVRKWQSEIS